MVTPSRKLVPAYWFIACFVGITLAVAIVMMLHVDELVETVVEPPAPGPGPSYAPSATAVVDPQTWDVVKDLSLVEGLWEVRKGYDAAGSKLRITKNKKSSLYPYGLRYEPHLEDKHPLDCGFYLRLDGDWRLSYCTGYDQPRTAGAAAHRIMFHVAHTKPDSMRLQIGNMLELRLHRM